MVDASVKRRMLRVRSIVAMQALRRSVAMVCVTKRLGNRVPKTARFKAPTTLVHTIDQCDAVLVNAPNRPLIALFDLVQLLRFFLYLFVCLF